MSRMPGAGNNSQIVSLGEVNDFDSFRISADVKHVGLKDIYRPALYQLALRLSGH